MLVSLCALNIDTAPVAGGELPHLMSYVLYWHASQVHGAIYLPCSLQPTRANTIHPSLRLRPHGNCVHVILMNHSAVLALQWVDWRSAIHACMRVQSQVWNRFETASAVDSTSTMLAGWMPLNSYRGLSNRWNKPPGIYSIQAHAFGLCALAIIPCVDKDQANPSSAILIQQTGRHPVVSFSHRSRAR